tara:strand:- start:2040 stop:3563 length:1524 start_codon:yes stop_codon:yes gene_type:complete
MGNIMNIKSMVIGLSSLFLIPQSFATSTSIDDFTSSDVVGQFAPEGVIGALAGTLTVYEAHRKCLEVLPFSESDADKYDGDSRKSYKDCMAQYVPFKVQGESGAGACSQQPVQWGQCQAQVPTLGDGGSYSVRNTFDTENFEGYASFQCSGGKLEYLNGGCSRAVNKCEDGKLVKWGVTTPLWADDTTSTPFVDKFGVTRHSPKGSCYASMPEALSGTLDTTSPSPSVMENPERFNMSTSVSYQRCFDGDWLPETAAGTFKCEYIPKSCPPQTYTDAASGCTFNIGSGSHDDVFNSDTPSPSMSVGAISAHCWDGNWEVKSVSCSKSCSSSIASNTWNSGVSGVSRTCTHSAKTYPRRLAPEAHLLIDNERSGMQGATSYICNNGTLNKKDEVCAPKGCGSLPAASWTGAGGATCSHSRASGEYQHGDIIYQTAGDMFSDVEGDISYTCSFGEYVVNPGATCVDKVKPPVECDASSLERCPSDAAYNDGFCCSESAGVISCFPSSGH